MGEKYILKCKDDLESIFSTIYYAFELKNKMRDSYDDSIQIKIDDYIEYDLFSQIIEVDTDYDKAEKTIQAIKRKLGFNIYDMVFKALCHFDDDRGSVVLGFLIRAFERGSIIVEDLSDKYVMRTMELYRKVNNEEQKMNGFLRFRDVGTFMLSEINPKCNLIPTIMWHFSDRFPGENFIIWDKNRNYAVVHPRFSDCFYVTGEELSQAGITDILPEDDFEKLWKIYFENMEIKDRHNEECQRNLCPKWYRENMIEFFVK